VAIVKITVKTKTIFGNPRTLHFTAKKEAEPQPMQTYLVVSAGIGTHHYAVDALVGKALCGRKVEYYVSGAFNPRIDCQRCKTIAEKKGLQLYP
jgi:hypothetical protein